MDWYFFVSSTPVNKTFCTKHWRGEISSNLIATQGIDLPDILFWSIINLIGAPRIPRVNLRCYCTQRMCNGGKTGNDGWAWIQTRDCYIVLWGQTFCRGRELILGIPLSYTNTKYIHVHNKNLPESEGSSKCFSRSRARELSPTSLKHCVSFLHEWPSSVRIHLLYISLIAFLGSSFATSDIESTNAAVVRSLVPMSL